MPFTLDSDFKQIYIFFLFCAIRKSTQPFVVFIERDVLSLGSGYMLSIERFLIYICVVSMKGWLY